MVTLSMQKTKLDLQSIGIAYSVETIELIHTILRGMFYDGNIETTKIFVGDQLGPQILTKYKEIVEKSKKKTLNAKNNEGLKEVASVIAKKLALTAKRYMVGKKSRIDVINLLIGINSNINMSKMCSKVGVKFNFPLDRTIATTYKIKKSSIVEMFFATYFKSLIRDKCLYGVSTQGLTIITALMILVVNRYNTLYLVKTQIIAMVKNIDTMLNSVQKKSAIGVIETVSIIDKYKDGIKHIIDKYELGNEIQDEDIDPIDLIKLYVGEIGLYIGSMSIFDARHNIIEAWKICEGLGKMELFNQFKL